MDDQEDPSLGPCCICGVDAGVRNIITLTLRAPLPGHGWGCVICGLPSDGASAVLCDPCCEAWQAGKRKLLVACRGYPGTDGRVPMSELTHPFDHNPDVDHG